MAFPTIVDFTEGSQTTDVGNVSMTYPSLAAGDLLLLVAATDGVPTFAIGTATSEGPRFPGTATSLSNAGTLENAEAWVSPGNVGADDGTEATITAATYDSPDISQILVASNFGFSIPSGAIITGIVVEIDRRNSAGAASDNRVQLATGTTFASLVGNNKADTALDWPTTTAVATYGSSTDMWGTTLTRTDINASSFAVFLSVQADAANTDIQVDYIRVTVHYVPSDSSIVTSSSNTTGSAAEAIFAKKIATGSESGTLELGLSQVEEVAWKLMAIRNWEGTLGINFVNSDSNGGSVPAAGFQVGTSTTPDALPHDPFNWGAEDTLFIWVVVADGGDTTSSGVPTNYTRIGSAFNTGGATGVCFDAASRQINTSSENPASTTISASVPWTTFVIAVRPQSDVFMPDWTVAGGMARY